MNDKRYDVEVTVSGAGPTPRRFRASQDEVLHDEVPPALLAALRGVVGQFDPEWAERATWQVRKADLLAGLGVTPSAPVPLVDHRSELDDWRAWAVDWLGEDDRSSGDAELRRALAGRLGVGAGRCGHSEDGCYATLRELLAWYQAGDREIYSGDPEPPAGVDVFRDSGTDDAGTRGFLCRVADGWMWRATPEDRELVTGGKPWDETLRDPEGALVAWYA